MLFHNLLKLGRVLASRLFEVAVIAVLQVCEIFFKIASHILTVRRFTAAGFTKRGNDERRVSF
jgi:hypothetical protein